MKDARGHGSNARGGELDAYSALATQHLNNARAAAQASAAPAHQGGVNTLGRLSGWAGTQLHKFMIDTAGGGTLSHGAQDLVYAKMHDPEWLANQIDNAGTVLRMAKMI